MENKIYQCYLNLVNAIIFKSISDFKFACRYLKKTKNSNSLYVIKKRYRLKKEKEEIFKFFKSDYFKLISNLCSDIILEDLLEYEKHLNRS